MRVALAGLTGSNLLKDTKALAQPGSLPLQTKNQRLHRLNGNRWFLLKQPVLLSCRGPGPEPE